MSEADEIWDFTPLQTKLQNAEKRAIMNLSLEAKLAEVIQERDAIAKSERELRKILCSPANLSVKMLVDENEHQKTVINTITLECKKLEDDFKEWFMDFLNQGCGQYNREKDVMEYDHMCLSTYEQGVRLALEKGWITKDQVLR